MVSRRGISQHSLQIRSANYFRHKEVFCVSYLGTDETKFSVYSFKIIDYSLINPFPI